MDSHFRNIGHPIPTNTNPAEFLLDVVSSDFSNSKEDAQERVQRIQNAWDKSEAADAVTRQVSERLEEVDGEADKILGDNLARPSAVRITTALLHRSWIKSYRDVVAYGIRIVMYMGM